MSTFEAKFTFFCYSARSSAAFTLEAISSVLNFRVSGKAMTC